MWSDRESNPDLIFRRDLFYPLNYQTIVGAKLVNVGLKTKLKGFFLLFFVNISFFI